MTADRPTTTEVDFFTWNRHFHGVRKHGAPDERPVKLTHAVARIACVIAAHINNESRDAHIGHRRIANCAQVSTATVADALSILEDAGWLIVERGARKDRNLYRLASPVAALRAASDPVDNSEPDSELASVSEARVPQSVRQGASVSEAKLRTSLRTTTTNEKISPVARAGADSATTTDELIELPTTWKPNRTHRVRAGKLGVDVDALAADFPARMAGKREKNFDRAFGRFLNDSADGCADTTFPYPATEVDPFAPSTSSVVDLGPDPTAQALDWIAPALWAEGLHPDALTADERAEVVLSHDPGVDPRDVASRIRANRVVSQVAKHVGPLSADEVAHVRGGVAHDYSDVDGLALDIRNARRGKALMIRAGDDPAGKDVGRLAGIWLECAEEDGERLPGDPLDRYRSPIPA
ncbi:hypothetical protein [Rhodococcus aetherivorans]